jgi:hypothetical protein
MEKPVVTLSERKCVPQKVPPHVVTVCVAWRRAAVVRVLM